MLSGKIKWFDENKNYGFILGDDQKEYFIHRKNMNPFRGSVVLDGEPVEFDLLETERGIQATNVVLFQ